MGAVATATDWHCRPLSCAPDDLEGWEDTAVPSSDAALPLLELPPVDGAGSAVLVPSGSSNVDTLRVSSPASAASR